MTIANRPDLCGVDPYLGTQASLAEAMRNLACVGARMVAITDGLNVASPRDPIENLKISEVIRALDDGLREIDVPVTGGNCSLYNESSKGPIPPAPMIGGVGLVPDVLAVPRSALEPGMSVYLLGRLSGEPNASVYGRMRTGSYEGHAPAVDLAAELRLAEVLIGATEIIHVAKDVGMGGVAVALAKLCIHGDVGLELSLPIEGRADWSLFGEAPALAVVAADQEIEAAAAAMDVPCTRLGVAGGGALSITGQLDIDVTDLRAAFSTPLTGGPS